MDYVPIVCDNGTGFVKVGFAKDNFPQHIFPSMIGRPLMRAEEKFDDDIELKDIMVGDEAAKYRKYLETSYPVENGIVKDWEGMQHLWDYTFNTRLQVTPANHKILLTEPPQNPLANRVKMFDFMFETYGFQAVQVSLQAMLVLCADGLMTGVVVDSGDGVTHCVGVYDGTCPENLCCRLNVAGRHITQRLIDLLQVRGYAFNSSADFDDVRQIKEKFCYVGYDLDIERKLALETTCLIKKFTLPDKRVIKLDYERYEAPEVLFKPSLGGESDAKGVDEQLFWMIKTHAARDIVLSLFNKIVLSGGTTMYPGLPSRMTKELRSLYLKHYLDGDTKRLAKFKLKVSSPPRRKHMVFLGGSFLADIWKNDNSDKFWVTKERYEEEGARRIVAGQR